MLFHQPLSSYRLPGLHAALRDCFAFDVVSDCKAARFGTRGHGEQYRLEARLQYLRRHYVSALASLLLMTLRNFAMFPIRSPYCYLARFTPRYRSA